MHPKPIPLPALSRFRLAPDMSLQGNLVGVADPQRATETRVRSDVEGTDALAPGETWERRKDVGSSLQALARRWVERQLSQMALQPLRFYRHPRPHPPLLLVDCCRTSGRRIYSGRLKPPHTPPWGSCQPRHRLIAGVLHGRAFLLTGCDMSLASLDPELTMKQLIKEYRLTPHRAYLERAQHAQDRLRPGAKEKQA